MSKTATFRRVQNKATKQIQKATEVEIQISVNFIYGVGDFLDICLNFSSSFFQILINIQISVSFIFGVDFLDICFNFSSSFFQI